MITAICEMQDQDVGIQTVRLIENTTESIEKFEDEMKIYQWMNENQNKQINM